MDINLAQHTIDEKMLKVRTHLDALKYASKAIPLDNVDISNPAEVTKVLSEREHFRALINILVMSLESDHQIACHDLAEYFQSWGA